MITGLESVGRAETRAKSTASHSGGNTGVLTRGPGRDEDTTDVLEGRWWREGKKQNVWNKTLYLGKWHSEVSTCRGGVMEQHVVITHHALTR